MSLNPLIPCISIALMLCVGDTSASSACKIQVDIVIAVDTTSSVSESTFTNVKEQVKSIVTGFTIGQFHTRLALVSISNRVNVIANFNDVKSLPDFNSAVDKLTFSNEKAKLSEGMKVAKDSVMTKARPKKITKVLVLVKDRRLERSADSAELSQIASQAAGVKSTGFAIHAVGVGGLWSTLELQSLFGTEYLLFKNKNALDSAKSIKNLVCDPDCPQNGAIQTMQGLCYGLTKHVISTTVALKADSDGVTQCRTERNRNFESCTGKQACNGADRHVSSCSTDGKVTVTTSWQRFDLKQQSCVLLEESSIVDCADAWKCKDQVADVIFLLDKSGSLQTTTKDKKGKFVRGPNNFIEVKSATLALAQSLNIGPDNVRVGVFKFGTDLETVIPFASINDRNVALEAISQMNETIISGDKTMLNLGFAEARRIFQSHGRKDVPKYIMLLTDGVSSDKKNTKIESDLLKNDGVTIIAVGIAMLSDAELKAITAPESETNLVVLNDFEKLKSWTEEFNRKMCLRLTAPNSKLCDDQVFYQHVSDCTDGKQTVTRMEFKYSSAGKCMKTIKMTDYAICKKTCHSPIDGNMYREGETWTSLCHEFQCTTDAAAPFLPFKSQCMAADGSCKAIGSAPFRCLNDITKKEVDNCQCVESNGKAALVIDNI